MIKKIIFLSTLFLSISMMLCTSSDLPTAVKTDTIAPVIKISGDNPLKIVPDSKYTQPTVTASDDKDGDTVNVTSDIKVSGETVNTAVIDTYSVIFTVTDAAGNVTKATLDVIVEKDTEAPVMEFKNDQYDTIQLYLGESTYQPDPGAKATDNIDGDVTSSIKDSGTITYGTAGTYKKYYYVSDAAGNNASIEQVYIVSNPTIVEDFEDDVLDQIGMLGINDSAGGFWYSYNDSADGMASTVEPVDSLLVGTKGAKDGTNGLYAKFTLKGILGDTGYAYSAVAFDFRAENEYIDLTKMVSLTFDVKGTKVGAGIATVVFINKAVNDSLAAHPKGEGIPVDSVWWGGMEQNITANITDSWETVTITAPTASPDSPILSANMTWDMVKDKVSGLEFAVSAADPNDTTSVIELYIDNIKINY